jgi:A/G-specific adenine glycosylase
MAKKHFTSLLLEWYSENKRDLPWRKTKDPYKIWLSEIMLQQTRVSQGLPYYKNFIKKYSSVKKLAHAPEKTVLRLWQGLGYYSRARNLHRCAKIVASNYKGKFPNTYTGLLTLPGIGEYTAAAISSIAFNEQKAVVDGNVFRVLARLNGISLNVNTLSGKKYFFDLANSIIPKQDPGLFNQAMMEFGALYCTPKNPNCVKCIFNKQCIAYQTESQFLYPVKNKLAKRRRRYFNYLVIRKQKSIWLSERKGNDVWKGLHEFYMMETNRALRDVDAFVQLTSQLELNHSLPPKSVRMKQILSHQEIVGKFFELKVSDVDFPIKGGKFYSVRDIDRIAKPVLITKYLESIQ